jgi:uncharacterized protein YaeQ
MALPSTLHHVELDLVHADAGVERRVALRVARHPSESLPRLWLRVLAYGLFWQEGIEFGPGLCQADEPELSARGPAGEEVLRVRVGRPEPARVQREADRSPRARVAVLFESPRRMEDFLEEARAAGLTRLGRVELLSVEPALLAALASVEERRTRLSLTVSGDHLYLEAGGLTLDGPLHRARPG